MAEAKQHYYDRTTNAMARHVAKKAVITEMRRQGHKIQYYYAKELYELADEYFRSHRDDVMQEVRAWQLEREVVQLLKVLHRKRKAEIKAKSVCTNQAHNGAQKWLSAMRASARMDKPLTRKKRR